MTDALSSALALLIATSPQLLAAAGPKPTATKSSIVRPSAGKAARNVKRPKKSSATKRTIKAIKIPNAAARRAKVRPTRNKEASGAMAALLRAYVNGTSDGYEKNVTQRMAKKGGSKSAAKRILARIEQASPNARVSKLGTKAVPSKAEKSGFDPAVSQAAGHHGDMVYLMPAVPLPPEGIPTPSSFKLERTGLVTHSTEDSDGSDELTSIAIIATPSGNDYTLSTVDLGSGQTANPGTQALAKSIYSGPAKTAVFITALIEDDGGNAAAAKAEIETLVGLAASVAATTQGHDRTAVLKTMVDYTIALDGVGADPGRAARSVVATPVASAEWAGLWGSDASNAGGIGYKVAVPHAMGSGSYELLLDVPAKLPEMKTVRLTLSNAKWNGTFPKGGAVESSTVTASIKGASHVFHFDGPPGSMTPLSRKVIAGDAAIGVSGTIKSKGIDYPDHIEKICAKARSETNKRKKLRLLRMCTEQRRAWLLKNHKNGVDSKTYDLDFTPGAGQAYTTTFSTQLNGFKPATNPKKPRKPSASKPSATPNAIKTRTAKGREAPWGSVKLSATNL